MAEKNRYAQREKRRFIEMASTGLAFAATFAGKTHTVRDIVNRAGELWDEINAQCPVEDD